MAGTLKSIAEQAGVGISAVSATLKEDFRHVRVSPQTRKRILRVAHDLNYTPNFHARSLVTGKSPLVACLQLTNSPEPLPERMGIRDLHRSGIRRGMEQVLAEHSIYTVALRIWRDEIRTSGLPEQVRNGSIGGVVHVHSIDAPLARQIAQLGIPAVVVGQESDIAPGLAIDRFYPDLDNALAHWVGELSSLGHRRIHLVLPRKVNPDQPGRSEQNFLELGFKHANLTLTCSGAVDYDDDRLEQGMHHEISRVMAMAQPPTAFIGPAQHISALSKFMAQQGHACPRDFSMVAFSPSDELFSPEHRVSMAGIIMPVVRVGRAAAQRLLIRMEESPGAKSDQPITHVEPCEHAMGQSVGPAPQ